MSLHKTGGILGKIKLKKGKEKKLKTAGK